MGRAIDRTGLGAARLGVSALVCLAGGQTAIAQEALVAAQPQAAIPAETPVAPPPPVIDAETALPPPSLALVQRSTSQCQHAAAAALCIPALTPVKLVIRAHLGSKISLSGQTFPIALAEPIVVDGKEVVPAGATGMGEVVHAKKSGGSGASGELILAARYLDVGGQKLRLRSLNFAVAGKDAMGTVQNINIASAVAFPALSLIGFFIQGKGIDVPEGVEAMAKTAAPFVLDPPVQAALSAAVIEPAPVSPPLQQGTTP